MLGGVGSSRTGAYSVTWELASRFHWLRRELPTVKGALRIPSFAREVQRSWWRMSKTLSGIQTDNAMCLTK